MLPQEINHRALDGALHELLRGPVLYLSRGPVMSGGFELPHYTTNLGDANMLIEKVLPCSALSLQTSGDADFVTLGPDFMDPEHGEMMQKLWATRPISKVSLVERPGRRPALVVCAAILEIAVSLRDARDISHDSNETLKLIEAATEKGRRPMSRIDLVSILTSQG